MQRGCSGAAAAIWRAASTPAPAPAPAPAPTPIHHGLCISPPTTAIAAITTATAGIPLYRISSLTHSDPARRFTPAVHRLVPGPSANRTYSSPAHFDFLVRSCCSRPPLLRVLSTAQRTAKVRQHTTVRMATTTAGATQQWTAPKVRDTFLQYFQDRGHTFGE